MSRCASKIAIISVFLLAPPSFRGRCRSVARRQLGVDEGRQFCQRENVAPRRAAEKLGIRPRDLVAPRVGVDVRVYEITRSG